MCGGIRLQLPVIHHLTPSFAYYERDQGQWAFLIDAGQWVWPPPLSQCPVCSTRTLADHHRRHRFHLHRHHRRRSLLLNDVRAPVDDEEWVVRGQDLVIHHQPVLHLLEQELQRERERERETTTVIHTWRWLAIKV